MNLYGYAIKSMDDYLPFQFYFSFFKRLIPSGKSLTNRHFFILDGHGSHVTLEAIEQAKKNSLDMIIFLSHTLHALEL
jgi:hypothetical protein